MKFGVQYPISGVHETPYGEKQAEMIWMMALGNGVHAAIVTSEDGGGTWQPWD